MLGLYCNRVEIVLQEGLLESCVAIQCTVLQQAARLVRKICIVIHLLYCDRKARQQARAGRAWDAQVAAGRWALGERARCRRAGRVGRAAGAVGARAAGGRWVGARQQRVGRWVGSRAGTAWARRGSRLGARCARGTAGLGVAWALDGCAGWASWASFGALCTWLSSGSIFGPGSTRYFPESPNEHCSL